MQADGERWLQSNERWKLEMVWSVLHCQAQTQSLCYAHACTCTNCRRILAREGLWKASGVCILLYLAGTWREPSLLMYFYERDPFGWQLGIMCVPGGMLGNLISEEEAEVERGQLVPTVKPDLFPCCSWWRWTTAAGGSFSIERDVFEKEQGNLGVNWRHSQQLAAGRQPTV